METRTPNPAHIIDTMGLLVEAPGFTPESFEAGVTKAQSKGYLHITPHRNGAVIVQSASSEARYVVTRQTCTCKGGQTAGHCYHRAAAIYISDFYGFDGMEILGFDGKGQPVTAYDRALELGEVA
jgi:hypothetical protein